MPNRFGLPVWAWVAALGVGALGFFYFRRASSSSSSSSSGARLAGTPQFSQQQEVQDFQIFSALTSAQQGSDLNFLAEVASLFAGGSSPSSSGGGGSSPTPTTPSPPSTGTVPPATTPASSPSAAAKQPGYGTVSTSAGQMIWLGVNQAGEPIYNVGGGAPVYFGNAQALATGSQYEQPGEDIYTPANYAGLVSPNTSVLGSAYT